MGGCLPAGSLQRQTLEDRVAEGARPANKDVSIPLGPLRASGTIFLRGQACWAPGAQGEVGMESV